MQPLIELLADARMQGRVLDTLPAGALPANEAQACDLQHALLARLGQGVGGWKVGAKAHDGPIAGAPLPADAVHHGAAVLPLRDGCVPGGRLLGLELELAFFFARDMGPGDESLADAEVLSAIDRMAASIEVVASRFAEGVVPPPLLAHADLMFHGALVVAEPVAFDRGRSLTDPVLSLSLDGRPLPGLPGHNPAGNPLRLLPWLVRHVARRGLRLPAGTVVTTGSYVGLVPVPAQGALVLGDIAGLPAVRLTLQG
ncbi:2-keto-4-pentenoate hydratase [Aquincola sp. J276]|uniref:2-keto-4-pentenoate hydratase n=1 Tax=Aquincola sp. J276 TaxID=2898432 RepID=UPI002151D0BE|nr:2-keto-4-pentenoate hydratase [Aquincola sp. J276]MCR5866525.1 2-keto-4-pentenoate hydratase [Aquincola sp. J276]